MSSESVLDIQSVVHDMARDGVSTFGQNTVHKASS